MRVCSASHKLEVGRRWRQVTTGPIFANVGLMATIVNLIDLREHCWRLSQLLGEIWQCDPVKRDDSHEFGAAGAWLEMAAGISNVDVDTGRFDESLAWCGLASKFEDARSELYSVIATELTVFMLAWGAFETVARILDPQSIPLDQRTNGANGLVDRVLFQLRPLAPFAGYDQSVEDITTLVDRDPAYAKIVRPAAPQRIGSSGIGLDMVRRIRNGFAHGSNRLPLPAAAGNGWCGRKSDVPCLIALSTRIVLVTMQMLLSSSYTAHNFEVRGLTDEEGFAAADVHVVLRALHVVEDGESP